jgi:hypothetical protein
MDVILLRDNRWNVFTEQLPSSCHIHHNMFSFECIFLSLRGLNSKIPYIYVTGRWFLSVWWVCSRQASMRLQKLLTWQLLREAFTETTPSLSWCHSGWNVVSPVTGLEGTDSCLDDVTWLQKTNKAEIDFSGSNTGFWFELLCQIGTSSSERTEHSSFLWL